MPFVDYLKRFFGIQDSDSQRVPPHNRFDEGNRKSLSLDVKEYQEPFNSVREYHEPFIPFGDDQFFEQQIQQLESFLRNIPVFGFSFGEPGQPPHQGPPAIPPDIPMNPFGPPHPDIGGSPFFGLPSIFRFGGTHNGIFEPRIEQEELSPRDEVLKPSYRSSNQHVIRDEDYDDLVKEKGPEVILDMLKKSEEADKNAERRLVPAPPQHQQDIAPRSFGHFSSTKFSFVNGEAVQEQITQLPDGTFEKKVTKTNSRGETDTQVSHLTADEVAPSMGGRFGMFGPRIW